MNDNLTGRRFYPSVFPVFCFFAGIVLGTLWVNLMAKEIQEQLGAFGQVRLMGNPRIFAPQWGSMIGILLKRGMAAGFLWLLGMTAFALPGLCAAAAYGGFSMASVIALMTIQNGLTGFPIYLLSVFPQALFYVPVTLILFLWGIKREKSTHLAGFTVLLTAVFFGVFAEACCNPYCMRLISFIK